MSESFSMRFPWGKWEMHLEKSILYQGYLVYMIQSRDDGSYCLQPSGEFIKLKEGESIVKLQPIFIFTEEQLQTLLNEI